MRINTLNRPIADESTKSQDSGLLPGPRRPADPTSVALATERELSGVQRVLRAAIANLQVSNQNMSAAASRLKRPEMSPEMVAFTEQQIGKRTL